jgi:hypothetical protein
VLAHIRRLWGLVLVDLDDSVEADDTVVGTAVHEPGARRRGAVAMMERLARCARMPVPNPSAHVAVSR